MTESSPERVAADHGWPSLLGALMRGESLTIEAAAWAMGEIIDGNATDAQIASFAVLLRAKGEEPAELEGMTQAMLSRAPLVRFEGSAVDLVGTGGDMARTVNITTMAALVVAGTGRQVIKHGNRSMSSPCGSADLLQALGVVIDLPADGVTVTVREAGIGFCFAPVFHAGMRHARGPRNEIGVPTVFNILGPLTNPARPKSTALGCADLTRAPLLAQVLADRGDFALVFGGDDGLDELTTTTTSQVWIVEDGRVRHETVSPHQLGIPTVEPVALEGGDVSVNAAVARELLEGKPGPVADAVLLNAAAGIVAADGLRGTDLVPAMADAMAEARQSIDSGSAATTLQRWVESSSSWQSTGR